MPSLADILNELAAAFDDARLDAPRREAEALVSGLLDLSRAALLARPDRPLTTPDTERLRAAAARRVRREPLAYILGEREFWSLPLEVTSDVLIPRPSTEALIELALERVARSEALRVLDVGTGSGALVAALGHELPRARLLATDVCSRALSVARRNLERFGLAGRAELRCSDLFDDLSPSDGPFDLIVSNPPYVPEGDLPYLMADVRDFEPALALVAGPEGLDVLRRLIAGAPAWLRPGGWLVVEHGAEQARAVAELFAAAGLEELEARRDLEGHPRAAAGRKPAEPG